MSLLACLTLEYTERARDFTFLVRKNQLECNSLRKIDWNVTVYLVYTGKCVYCTYYAACALEVNPNTVIRAQEVDTTELQHE